MQKCSFKIILGQVTVNIMKGVKISQQKCGKSFLTVVGVVLNRIISMSNYNIGFLWGIEKTSRNLGHFATEKFSYMRFGYLIPLIYADVSSEARELNNGLSLHLHYMVESLQDYS